MQNPLSGLIPTDCSGLRVGGRGGGVRLELILGIKKGKAQM